MHRCTFIVDALTEKRLEDKDDLEWVEREHFDTTVVPLATDWVAVHRAIWTVELDVKGDVMEGKGHAFRSADNHSWDVEIKLARNK